MARLNPAAARVHVVIRGAVQGVGFRPFVYRLATELNLAGWVSNSTEGVLIEAEGPKPALDQFLIRLNGERPRRAFINSFEYSFLDAAGWRDFQIRKSIADGPKRALVLPDIATCSECCSEIFDPSNRRYLYPFTNCTNCGPRFTIIETLPYDRANTTMRRFTMCAQCRSEYENPLDRRFHAQPNACPDCGPEMELWNDSGATLARREEAVDQAAAALRKGSIVALKGLGGFHLLVDAGNGDAVRRLRSRKNREEKPFALMAASLESVREICAVDSLEERLLCAPESPIVLLSRRDAAAIADMVAPRNPYLGVMLPYTPLHHILMRRLRAPVVATSGNRSEEPIAIDNADALQRLRGIADLFLVHNRPIRRHADDSIVRILLGREQVLRRARGYAPLPVGPAGAGFQAAASEAAILATGSHLKNTAAVAAGPHIFVSQHIGDLSNAEALGAFRRAIDDFETLYDLHPEIVACDMHPDYASTSHAIDLADARSVPLERVQHHWAHVLACMAENRVEAPALGVAWDGAGYGPDGTIWGGEFLLALNSGFRRVAHFRTFPLPGGDAAAKKPKRAAAGLLYEMLGSKSFNGETPALLRQMLDKGIRSPRTSSAGRLFDAVAAIAGVRGEVTFEGQAAMELEFAAQPGVRDVYEFKIDEGDPLIIDWAPMIRRILADVRNGAGVGIISAKFHNTLARIIVEAARAAGERRVLLTGGCFQNRYLTERTVEQLEAAGFSPYWHQRVPPNDGGIALGQACAARRLVVAQENLCVLQSQAK